MMVEFEIKKIKNHPNEDFSVTFETVYGEKCIKFNKNMKYLHIETKKPQFLHKIKEFVEKKYSSIGPTKTSNEFKDLVGIKFKSEDIEDRSIEFLAESVIQKRKTKEEKVAEIESSMVEENAKAEVLIGKHHKLLKIKWHNEELAKKNAKLKIEVNK